MRNRVKLHVYDVFCVNIMGGDVDFGFDCVSVLVHCTKTGKRGIYVL